MQTMRKPDTMQTKFATQPQKKLFGKCKKFELKTQKKNRKPKDCGCWVQQLRENGYMLQKGRRSDVLRELEPE
jgi:hypothetical protein